MNIENLTKVIKLKEKLDNAIFQHKGNMSLTEPRGGKFELPPMAFISIGGDHYGNGVMHKLEVNILDSREIVMHCRKIQSESWSKIVSIRAELRDLGVKLEEVSTNA